MRIHVPIASVRFEDRAGARGVSSGAAFHQRGTAVSATDQPPAPPGPPASSDVLLRPSYKRLLLGGVVGAVACSAVAALIALQLAKPDVPATPTAGGSVAPGAELAAVEDLEADQPRWTSDPRSWRIVVSWQAVDAAVAYLVSRDGRRLDRIDGTELVDDSVTPAGHYRYEVVALGADGTRSAPARTAIRTDPLPKDAARVQGRWLLTIKIRSSNIGAGGGRLVATLSPDCARGPCDVDWAFTDVANTGTAERRGASYIGTGHGSFLTRGCHGETISSAVTISFRVERARTVGDAWRATLISGTITESVPSFSNCLSARNVWTFTGASQG